MLTKKIHCIKTANKQDQFKQKQSFKREKEDVRRFVLVYFRLLITEKLAVSLVSTSVIEAGVPLRSLKLCFGFLC